MAKMKNTTDNPGGLFIPAGIIGGMGVGFLREELVAWMFIGLGTGFLLFALTSLFFPFGKNRDESDK